MVDNQEVVTKINFNPKLFLEISAKIVDGNIGVDFIRYKCHLLLLESHNTMDISHSLSNCNNIRNYDI